MAVRAGARRPKEGPVARAVARAAEARARVVEATRLARVARAALPAAVRPVRVGRQARAVAAEARARVVEATRLARVARAALPAAVRPVQVGRQARAAPMLAAVTGSGGRTGSGGLSWTYRCLCRWTVRAVDRSRAIFYVDSWCVGLHARRRGKAHASGSWRRVVQARRQCREWYLCNADHGSRFWRRADHPDRIRRRQFPSHAVGRRQRSGDEHDLVPSFRFRRHQVRDARQAACDLGARQGRSGDEGQQRPVADSHGGGLVFQRRAGHLPLGHVTRGARCLHQRCLCADERHGRHPDLRRAHHEHR